jgi:hypothetical protein
VVIAQRAAVVQKITGATLGAAVPRRVA